jgi:endonuclease/exonuclease/phosphatase family metal-dependent hydrolase
LVWPAAVRGAAALALTALPACEAAVETWDPHGIETVPVHVRSSLAPGAVAAPATLKVMAWNIKYGAGRIDFWFDLWGDRVQMSRDEVETNMAHIYALINEVDPDLLMTEEIEINSRRSAYVNMVTGILEHTSLNYAAYFPTWRAKYIPSEGLGRMDLGNALFSRYPIKSAQRIAQVDRSDQDPLTRYFYLHRAVGRVVVDVGRDVAAMVVHTEAYDKDGTKGKQLVQIHDLMNREPLPFVVGGDFNALPPGTVKLSDFNDLNPREKGSDFEQPPYPSDEMVPFYQAFVPHVSLDRYGSSDESQRLFFTHSVIGRDKIGSQGEPGFWTRQLDFLFVRAPDGWVAGSTDNLQLPGRGAGSGGPGITSDPMDLSDHCPVLGTWAPAP